MDILRQLIGHNTPNWIILKMLNNFEKMNICAYREIVFKGHMRKMNLA